MKKITMVYLCFFYALVAFTQVLGHEALSSLSTQDYLEKSVSRLGFEENKGQLNNTLDEKVNFRLQNGNITLNLLNKGLQYRFIKSEVKNNKDFGTIESEIEYDFESSDIDIEFVGSNPNPAIKKELPSSDYTHYLPKTTFVFRYQKITYTNIYPNIDWVIYVQKDGQNDVVKYDFIVRRGGNPKQIVLKIRGANETVIKEDGSLLMKNLLGEISEKSPISFQDDNEVNTRFVLKDNLLSFDIDEYDPTKTLTIDPLLVWATYFGDNGHYSAYRCLTDKHRSVYLSGERSYGWDNGSGHITTKWDVFIAKFNSEGTKIWTIYYTASDNIRGSAQAIDSFGNIYLSGQTNSASGIFLKGFQSSLSGQQDAFLIKLDSTGILQWGTYYGGAGTEGGFCTLDKNNNIYLSGSTNSQSDISFNGFQNTHGGGSRDGFVAKFDSNGNRLWATYYGGSGDDFISSGATDDSANFYFAGKTSSTTGIAFSGFRTSYSNKAEGFLVKFNSNGQRVWGTYYGGETFNGGHCATDIFGNVYLAGETLASSGVAHNGFINKSKGNMDAYLVKFDKDGKRDWATYFGTDGGTQAFTCISDLAGNVYISGSTQAKTNIAYEGYQSLFGGGSADVFIAKFDPHGDRIWSSFYGGEQVELSYGLGVDLQGDLYVAGKTRSLNGISKNGYKNTKTNFEDAFLAKFSGCYPPPEPEALDSQQLCIGDRVSDLMAIGNEIKWYDNPTGGKSLSQNLFLQKDKVYFASQTFNRCESVTRKPVFADITVLSSDVLFNGILLASVEVGATYQWLDCNNLFAPIDSAIEQTFTPDSIGNFAVRISKNGCVITSNCINTSNVNTSHVEKDLNLIKIYPNPVLHNVFIEIESQTIFEVFNAKGVLVKSLNLSLSDIVDLSDLSQGVYFIKAKNQNFKIIKL